MTIAKNLFSFGGCVYRMHVDGRHAASLAALAAMSVAGAPRPPFAPGVKYLAEIDYMHTSNLPQGRALWLRRQITSGEGSLRWAVSCDGDTTFDASQLYDEIDVVKGSAAMGIAPVRIGGTEDLCNINITDADERSNGRLTAGDGVIGAPELLVHNRAMPAPEHGRRAFMSELTAVLDGDRRIVSGGFGLVVFNLNWFRQHWPLPAPERCSIDTGEDIEFCRSVRERGGRILALRIRTDHFAFGEKQTR